MPPRQYGRCPGRPGRLGLLVPEPAECVGKENTAVVGTVPPVADHHARVVPRTRQGRRRLQVLREPVHLAPVPTEVPLCCVEEDANRPIDPLGELPRVGIAIGHLGEARIERDDLTEDVRPLPSGGEGGVTAGAASADAPPGRVIRQ